LKVTAVDRSPFLVSPTSADEVTVFLRGEIDMEVERLFVAAIEQAVALRPRLLLLDVASVTFMDSTGLRAVVRAEQALGVGASVRVGGASQTLRRLFAITGLERFLVADGDQPG
jgi:anti-sigma B factor antagonist